MNYYTHACVVIENRVHAAVYQEIFRFYDDVLMHGETSAHNPGIISAKTATAIRCMEELALNAEYTVLQRTGQFSFWGDSLNLDVAAELLQLGMRELKDDGVIVFQYALTASRETVDAYGGGAIRVTRKNIKHVSTNELAQKFIK